MSELIRRCLRAVRRWEQPHILLDQFRWLLIAAVAGVLAGTASAILLASLEWVTDYRESHKWIIALLPLAGLSVGLLYRYYGRTVEAGNNLILDEIHLPKSRLPFRMTPLILLGTAMTHLFGGSAGREGTAIQTGASLADQLTGPLGLNERDRRILLMAGLSGGFGSVFGTPLSGAIFGIEVLAIGRIGYSAIFPCFVAAFIGDFTTRAWGIHHTIFHVTSVPDINLRGFLSAAAAGVGFGLVGMTFSKTTHAISHWAKTRIAWSPMRPFIGGTLVAAAVFALGTTRFIGLGIPTIVAAFSTHLPPYDFAVKLLFTTVTLGFGFKGGEVTPLFFIGATMGNALSWVLPLPSTLLAGMGFVAVFAGAANTPIASTLMAVELFGAEAGAYAAIACVVSYLFSGHAGIYHAQRVGHSKHSRSEVEEGLSLALVTQKRDGYADNLLLRIEQFGLFEGSLMDHLGVVRLYFSAAQVVRADRWWKRLAPQSLGVYLLMQAHKHGIEQALLQRVIGGYLKNHELLMDNGEIPQSKLPQCLELVGEEENLQAFLNSNQEYLKHVRVVFLRGQEARVEAAIDRDELEQMIAIERADDEQITGTSDEA